MCLNMTLSALSTVAVCSYTTSYNATSVGHWDVVSGHAQPRDHHTETLDAWANEDYTTIDGRVACQKDLLIKYTVKHSLAGPIDWTYWLDLEAVDPVCLIGSLHDTVLVLICLLGLLGIIGLPCVLGREPTVE